MLFASSLFCLEFLWLSSKWRNFSNRTFSCLLYLSCLFPVDCYLADVSWPSFITVGKISIGYVDLLFHCMKNQWHEMRNGTEITFRKQINFFNPATVFSKLSITLTENRSEIRKQNPLVWMALHKIIAFSTEQSSVDRRKQCHGAEAYTKCVEEQKLWRFPSRYSKCMSEISCV